MPGSIVRQYYLAMAVPYAIDVATLVIYAAINGAPQILLPTLGVSTLFLLVGVGIASSRLIRPIRRFAAGEIPFEQIESRLAHLPRNSAIVVGLFDTPMVVLRVLSHRLDFTFGAMLEPVALPDAIASLLVEVLFNVALTYFVINAYFGRLCEYLFRTRGANLSMFRGRFRDKVALALISLSFTGMILLAGDIASYSGDRLIREATVDFAFTVAGAAFIYYWASQALTQPIDRLESGMQRIADADYTVRLPVTSNDELGHAARRFNQMVEGLAERAYLRDTFGKYVSESVATAILDRGEHTGRATNTVAEATLMFTDIEGFTGLSESMAPTEVADVLNAYLGTVVPIIQRHGGVINSFIGDGLFASFNLPLPLKDHAGAALRAAREIQQALAVTRFAGGINLRTRIGLNTGPVIGVTIGTADRLNYTLLGDAVNVAARVEQINKKFETLILATESTILAAGAADSCTRLGETDVRGHRGNAVLYSVGPAA